MFYPLYPLGIGAEWWLLYCAIPPGGRISPLIPPFFVFLLVLYVPGEFDPVDPVIRDAVCLLSD